jgi:hypothetical protein
MEIVTMILSGLALLAASVCLILLIQEKKRNQKRNTALVNLIDNYFTRSMTTLEGVRGCVVMFNTTVTEMNSRVKKLEEGISPDYNEAVAAKQAVDDFNMGISAILNFDPMAAMKKSREEQEAR